MHPASYYYKLNFNKEWVSTHKALANENGVPIDDIPIEVFLNDEVWLEEDPHTKEWSEAIKDYYNDCFTKGSLYDEIFEIDTKEIRVFSDISKDDPLHQDIPAKFKSN
ncbi:hypothetical protein L1987_32982 [Smallanthus sonchifolius]|uniref:Uncharacterized protein n=1 Tax=Smallanthus sonchifolius TaxID=185202 RepID=A0ACB9HPQ9_9ASTR|nr:hypothetical protein L1987_32982 [Smallanthus sonchifolius]